MEERWKGGKGEGETRLQLNSTKKMPPKPCTHLYRVVAGALTE